MKIFIEPNQPFSAPVRWVFDLLAVNKRVAFAFVGEASAAGFVVSDAERSDVWLDLDFYKNLKKIGSDTEGSYSIKNYDLKIKAGASSDDGARDFDVLAAIFYAVNCLQEFSPTASQLDKYGRFRFSETWQARLDCIENNVVQYFIDVFFLKNEKLKQIVLPPPRPSSAFLTHDIDSLFGGFWQEGKWAARHFRLDKILHLLFLEAVRRPSWLNIDDILRIHTAHEARSTYFFLTEKGRNNAFQRLDTEGFRSVDKGKLAVKNADYRTDDKRVQGFFQKIRAQGSEICLHKSTMPTDFAAEFSHLPPTAVWANRYHFLTFALPQAWQTMDAAGVRLDASLGFAEHFGFRNGYGLPFQPFDFEKKEGQLGLVVAPMHIMDGNFDTYMKLPESQILPTILDFFEKNRTNAVLNVLWHNPEFAPFRFEKYLKIYKKLLIYLRETRLPTVTASEIIAEFG